ncbi:MAG: hypothetical protein FJX65_04665 [Alphaproteobacteria bacterium]|nr:hypothetical protein [Alphaproteobacteria bacterium]
MLTWTDVADRDEPAFNEWYDREHLGERLAMPGFRRVRRYRAITGGPRYLAIYDTTDVSDLASPAYQRLLREQSAESRRIMSRFTTLHRLTCRRSIQCGSLGFGGTMGVLCFFPATGEDDATRRHLDESLPALVVRPGVIGAGLWENDLAVANGPAQSPIITFDHPTRPEWVVYVEGAEDGPTLHATRELTESLNRRGVSLAQDLATYRFLCGNHRRGRASSAVQERGKLALRTVAAERGRPSTRRARGEPPRA